MRRTHLRGHSHVVKRLVVHMGRFNLGLFLRTLFGIGTPRGCTGPGAPTPPVVLSPAHGGDHRAVPGPGLQREYRLAPRAAPR